MNNIIQFTPAELIAVVISICGAITGIGAVIALLVKAVDRIKAPERAQDKRIELIELKLDKQEKTIEKFKEFFANDDNRFKSIEKSNKITQGALLALLKHALNGNDINSLKDAEKTLESYLIDK